LKIDSSLSDFLNEKAVLYNNPALFVHDDPICIPKSYDDKRDIEFTAFITAMLSWGQRVTIINKCTLLFKDMGPSPVEFLLESTPKDLKQFASFKHRTFNGEDAACFLQNLKRLYTSFGSLENAFLSQKGSMQERISGFKTLFFNKEKSRSNKHLPDPLKGSAAKRFNMYLRWMVRQEGGVDFGIWQQIKPAELYLPLDVHTANVSRKLGLLKRTQNDWKAVEEISDVLRFLDPKDPIKYDFALFGLGAIEKF